MEGEYYHAAYDQCSFFGPMYQSCSADTYCDSIPEYCQTEDVMEDSPPTTPVSVVHSEPEVEVLVSLPQVKCGLRV